VAWLRRLGMPLAVIRSVSGLPPAQAAADLLALALECGAPDNITCIVADIET
jgi:serine/threonine protein phosphatase PrpC